MTISDDGTDDDGLIEKKKQRHKWRYSSDDCDTAAKRQSKY